MLVAPAAYGASSGDWTSWGFDTSNTRNNPSEKSIGVGNVGRLAVKWKLPTEGNVSATPAVENGVVYAPDFAGNLYAVDAASGAVKWKASIPTMTGIPGNFARATPAISGNTLVFGDQAGKVGSVDGYLLGVDKRTGTLLWKTKVEGGYPIMTQSPTVVDGVAYVGAASYEEALVRTPADLPRFHDGRERQHRGPAVEDLHGPRGIHRRIGLGQLARGRLQARDGVHRHGQQLLGARLGDRVPRRGGR
jgi:polyvinyl alcohol dehydrogenase (cytochrome)